MFGNSNKQAKHNSGIDSLVGNQTKVRGDIYFCGGLHIDGEVRGKVIAEGEHSMLTTSEQCRIDGDVHVHNLILNGEVVGDVHAHEHVELAANARVTGNVYYKVIEMMMGAEVNGSLIHVVDGKQDRGQGSHSQASSPESKDDAQPVDNNVAQHSAGTAQ
jgi:cytoskeletal protein CcmA (bactofilin family)